MGGQDGFFLVECINPLFSHFEFAAQPSIDGTHGLIPHHREGFSNIGPAGVELEFGACGSQRLQTGFKAKKVVQHRLE